MEVLVEPGRSQMTIWLMRIACWITKTLRICNTYYFSTAKMVTRTRFMDTLYVHTFLFDSPHMLMHMCTVRRFHREKPFELI